MSMKAKWIELVEIRTWGNPTGVCCAGDFEETGLRAKPVLKGIITFPEFTPDLDWYTYVFEGNRFGGRTDRV